MRSVLALVLALCALPALAQAPAPAESAEAPLGAVPPEWQPLDEAVATAAREDRIVFIAALADWCPWCRRLEQEVLPDPAVRDYLNAHFESVRLNTEGETELSFRDHTLTETEFAAVMGVSSVPAILILGPDGEYLTQIRGFQPADRLLLMLRYINEADYETESFDQFLERIGAS